MTTAWVHAETRADRIPHIPVGRNYRHRPSSILDRRDVEAMSARLLSRGLAPKTVANTLKILHGVFEHAIDLEWTSDNPVR